MRFAVNLKFFPYHWKLHDQTFYRWKALDRITTSSNISSVGRCHKYNSPVPSEITFLYRNLFVTFACNGQHSLTFLITFFIITRTTNCKSIFWLVRFLHEEFPREDWADHMIWCGNPLLPLFWVFLATVWECARLSVEKFGFFFLGQFPSSFLAWPLFHSTDRMAKASTLAETLAKELQCGFCSQQYKEPRVLPCLHSFCKSCLEEMLSKQGIGWKVGCPWCRASVEVSCWF